MENVVIKDLYKYNFVSDINANSNGDKVIFTMSKADEEYNKYVSRLYVLDTKNDSYKPLTGGGEERLAIWIDNENILFTKPSKNKDENTVYYKMSVNGGEAEECFTVPLKVSAIKKINDDNYLITSQTDLAKEEKREDRAESGKDFYVFDEIPFWFNGQGVKNKIRNTAYIYTVSTNDTKKISDDFMNVQGTTISDDKSKILFWGPVFKDKMSTLAGVYEYHIGSASVKEIVRPEELSIYNALYFNGKIIVEGSDKKNNSSQDPKLYTVDSAKELIELANLDGAIGSGVGSDIGFGGGKSLKIVGDKIYCLFTSWGNSYLSVLNDKLELSFVNEREGGISGFDIANDKAYCVALRNYDLPEIYAIDLNDGNEKKITSFNDEYYNTHTVSKPERFVFTAKDGHELEGWVIKPIDYKNDEKYPGVLSMRGGPKVSWGALYHHEMQCMANMGYFVFYTNPRGSAGRGDEFSTLAGKLGEIDYDDFMEFTDEVLKRYECIDENRLGICGGSYAGFMCNWMIGHTDRFKAAVSQRSISNYVSKCLTTDIGYYHNLSQTGATPWENYEKMWYHSPLKYIKNANTPTLFIQSDMDYRCWLSEPLQMFVSLRSRGIPSKVALFHGENHELSRAGKPHNRIDRLKEISGWFEKYL